MDLTNHHRRALVECFKKALENKERITRLLESESAKNDLSFAENLEIDDFLNNEHIKIIEASLCDVEINY